MLFHYYLLKGDNNMRFLFYSTTSEGFNPSVERTMLPNKADEWDGIAAKYPEHEFIVMAPLPGLYLFDVVGEGISRYPEKVKYVVIDRTETVEEIADKIAAYEPDIAVAIAIAGTPHDWNPIKETMIAEELEKKGIRTLAQNMNVSIGSFDKWRTNIMLRMSGAKIAKGVYVHYGLLNTDKNNKSIKDNVYREYILNRVRQMNYPIIIKDTLGSGSMGIQIAAGYEEAEAILTSEKLDTDVIAEELIQGEQFGTEIHGVKGRYSVLPPFAFSTNKEGITDPYQSVKFGPVTDEKYGIAKLQKSLIELAEKLELTGTTQVDLVYKDGEWYIIELNPRWSGMTTTAAAAEERCAFSIFVDSVLGIDKNYSKPCNVRYVMNFKVPGLTDEQLDTISKLPFVKNVMQFHMNVPGRPEVFISEIIIGGVDTTKELWDRFSEIDQMYPGLIPQSTKNNARTLLDNYH